MSNNKMFKNKFLRILILIIGGCGFFMWYFFLAPRLLWKVTYTDHILPMANAVSAFDMKFNRLPINLKEMADSGFLPKTGKIYFSPIEHETFFPKMLNVENSDFELSYRFQEVIVKAPDSFYMTKRKKIRFNWLADGSLNRSVWTMQILKDHKKKESLDDHN